jgi:hypothetical protein
MLMKIPKISIFWHVVSFRYNLVVGSWMYTAVSDVFVGHQHYVVRWGHPETSKLRTIGCSVHECPKLISAECYDDSPPVPTVVLAASACTRHDF